MISAADEWQEAGVLLPVIDAIPPLRGRPGRPRQHPEQLFANRDFVLASSIQTPPCSLWAQDLYSSRLHVHRCSIICFRFLS